ncbi:adenylate/guanylate cyclase domain-containing protein [Legionella sp. km772]|uniref:adenylate/guanylate cyclase domain-containing protein n=1 Tax=Legionella sp. km772 TaxID=2498111 RepID=UPI0013151211|nr:adenylate/guanylate cyclase domain-containing protein [Legionella sp. km772]
MHLTTLNHEILRSEILRVTILMSFFLFLAVYVAIWAVVSPIEFTILFKNKVSAWSPSTFLLVIAGYYFLLRLFLCAREKKELIIPKGLQFLTLFLETSIPTLFLCILAQFHEPVYVLLSSRILLYFVFIILSALTLDIRLCFFTGLVAALEYNALGFYFFTINHLPNLEPYVYSTEQLITRGMIFFAGGCVTAFVTARIKQGFYEAFKEAKEREEIAQIFGRQVSPEVVNMLLSQGKTAVSEAKFVCVMFLDIRNFTTYSENKKPQEVVNYLNQMFNFMIEIINKHHGIINKFLGDGFMAVFGAPISGDNDTNNAVKAAEEILIQIEKEIANGTIPNTRIGIGLHCGIVVTGNVGTKRRQEYTIIGDVVNLASRIEQLNKTYMSQLLISEDVHLGLKDKRGELLGDITVHGRHQPIKIYRLK